MAILNLVQDVANEKRKNIESCLYSGQIFFYSKL